ncbi:hypothetical protein PMAYCL1PPCAC_25766, partial [Pristionchus mayeri]
AISCVAGTTQWIEAGSSEITCEYAVGDGESSQPGDMCPMLTMLPCPGGTCDYNQLVYTKLKSSGEWRVMCKMGSLATDFGGIGEPQVADCMTTSFNVYNNAISMATCVTSADAIDQNCVAMAGGQAAVTVTCKLGACTLACADSTKQFKYNIAGAPVMSAMLKCA